MGVDYSELIKFRDNLVRMDKEWDKFIEKFLLDCALRVLAETKKNTHVITNHLRNSWQLTKVTRSGDTLRIEIFNPLYYASYYEHGHKQTPGRYVPGYWQGQQFIYDPKSKEGMVLKQSWVEGHFTCDLAIARMQRQVPARWDKAFSAWVAQMGF